MSTAAQMPAHAHAVSLAQLAGLPWNAHFPLQFLKQQVCFKLEFELAKCCALCVFCSSFCAYYLVQWLQQQQLSHPSCILSYHALQAMLYSADEGYYALQSKD